MIILCLLRIIISFSYHLLSNSQVFTFPQYNSLQIEMDCEICCESKPELLNLTNCSHRFCESCCIMHIREKADRFVEVLCPYPGCNRALRKDSQAYQKLPHEVKQKLKKHEDFTFMQKNPHLKACSQKNCIGTINTKEAKKICSKCGKAHCPKCWKQFHDGNCIIDDFDKQMLKNNYQKCPNCSIWVEKKEGCQYIDCKCGTAFCYKCGAQFASDPCRRGELLENQYEIRKNLSEIKYHLPESCIGYAFLPFKFLLQIILIIVLIPIVSLTITFCIFTIFLCALSMTPWIAIQILCHELPDSLKCIGTLILFPFLAVVLIFIFIGLFFLYPVFRNYYHHGIYDGMEKMITGAAKCFIVLVKNIFTC